MDTIMRQDVLTMQPCDECVMVVAVVTVTQRPSLLLSYVWMWRVAWFVLVCRIDACHLQRGRHCEMEGRTPETKSAKRTSV